MAEQKQQRVEVIRAYRHRGKTIGVGSVVDHDIADAVMLVTAGKARAVQADTKLHETDDIPAPPSAALPGKDPEPPARPAAKK